MTNLPSERPLQIAVAGFGYWGTKLARNVAAADGCRLAAVCDPVAARRDAAAAEYGATPYATIEELLTHDGLDGVVLATPAADHHRQALAALFAGKHILVEKPLAMTTAECDELERVAVERSLVLMSGHTFLYSAPVRLLRGLIEEGALGRVLYCYGQRLNLGAIRSDTSAMWDLAPHDVSILVHLLGAAPTSVSAQQFSLLGDRHEDVGMLSMRFADDAIGHVHVSRLDPRKVRELTVVGDRKMAVYDDTDAEMPIRIYDKGVDPTEPTVDALMSGSDFAQHRLELRTGDVLAPKVTGREPLRVEIEDFLDCIRTGREPVSNARVARNVVAVLEAAERSSRMGGTPVDLAGEEQPVARLAA